MKTTKPITTISFNTPDFLRLKLEELRKAGIVTFWVFIKHKPEDDEGGKKEHIHLFIEPSKMIQTDSIKSELIEPDPNNPKPLGCLPFNRSKFDPWCLYALHDKRYLASKGQTRRFHYSYDDFVTSDEDYLLFLYKSIDMMSLSPYADMLDAQQQGLSFGDYFARGTIPLPQVALFEKAWVLLSENKTFRNGFKNHPNEPNIDFNPVTGEAVVFDARPPVSGADGGCSEKSDSGVTDDKQKT